MLKVKKYSLSYADIQKGGVGQMNLLSKIGNWDEFWDTLYIIIFG